MPLDELAKGDKVDLHLHLYTPEVEIIDALCRQHRCSRSAVVEAFARRYGREEMPELAAGKKGPTK